MTAPTRQASITAARNSRFGRIDAVRQFFKLNAYLEIETPIRQPTQAPEEHIDAVGSGTWFLQTSPEMCMKRLLASGYRHIFQICRCFREGERGHRHLPEMTLLEWYTIDADYHDMMAQTEALIRHVAREVGMTDVWSFKSHRIDWNNTWPKISVDEAFLRHAAMPVETALAGNCFDEILTTRVEPHLGVKHPTFLIDYPAKLGALARLSSKDATIAERFELYIGGVELCNGFSELTDPKEQKERFEETLRARTAAGKEPYPLPKKFLAALEDVPPAAGNALGLDRLVMLMADTDKIDDVVVFTPEEL